MTNDIRRQIITAIMGLLETKEVLIEPRPTIDQMEANLNSEDPIRYFIKPDGSVVEVMPAKTTVGAVADLIMGIVDAEVATLRSQVEEMREALEPFAELGMPWTKDGLSDDSPWATAPDELRLVVGANDMRWNAVTVGQLRRAAAVLSKQK